MVNKSDITLITALRSITLEKSYFERHASPGDERVTIEVTTLFTPSSDELDKDHGFKLRLDTKIVGQKFSDDEEATDVYKGECSFTGHFAILDNNTVSAETIENSRHYFETQLFPVVRGHIVETLNLMGVSSSQGAPWDMGFGRDRQMKEESDHPEKQEA